MTVRWPVSMECWALSVMRVSSMNSTVRRCEAMVPTYNDHWVMCGKTPVEWHHRLTRARGGLILDKAGETRHHMYLCHEHHMRAHDEGSAFENGLLIDGYVVTGSHGNPVYVGSDEYLSKKYPLVIHDEPLG